MLFLPTILTVLSASIPTGISTTTHLATERSPLESLPASFQNISAPIFQPVNGNTVLVVVADYLATPLAAELSRFQTDLTSEGWNVVVQNMSGGTAADLKTLLQGTPDIDGAIFVGFLPCAWYEEDYWAPEEFPCELYFMDLDGIWADTNSNGLFDSHTGDVAPDIWLGRIDAHAADFGSEIQMLSQYFQKNHLYRTGSLTPPSRAITYIDDDWSSYTDCGLNSIYAASDVTVVNSESQTTAENYLSRLAEGYEFVHLMAHSCPWGHTFKVPSGMAGTVMAPEIAQVNPNTAFLQLFSCSNARWTETGCLGNWYLFGTDMGLLVSGAAKTGSMLDFEYFYNPVGSGSTFGEAFRDWWEYVAQGGFSAYEKAWFYGNALLGDPTLKPVGGTMLSAGVGEQGYGSTDVFPVSASSYSDCFPAVDTHGSMTAVAWLTGENGRLDVAARFHDDSSDSWSQVYIVDADEYWDNAVSVCFDDSGVPWLAWSDFELSTYSYQIKTAHGIPFESVETAVPQDGYQVSPDLAFTDRMWLVWQDWEATGGRIILKALDGSVPIQQISSTGSWAESPAISGGPDSRLHALWVKQTPTGSSVMWAYGDETGFSAPAAIGSGACHSPHIAFVDGSIIAVWQSDSPVSAITSRIWNGSAWTAEEIITSGEIHFINPVVCATPEGEPVVYWQEGRSNAVAMASVYSTEGWSVPFQPVSPGGPVWSPVASGNGIFWAGTQGGDWNIYTDTSTGIEHGTSPAEFMPTITSNPVRSYLEIRLPQGSPSFSGSISIFDISGRKVLESSASIESGNAFSINCTTLPSGIYSLVIQNADAPVRFTLLR